MDTLELRLLPQQFKYTCTDGSVVDFGRTLDALGASIRLMAGVGLITQNPSFGIAVSRPYFVDDEDSEADAASFETEAWSHLAFTGGWGPTRRRYVANAVRKMRPLYRDVSFESTLEMVFAGEAFDNPVDSAEPDGSFRWGDFPYGGAVWVNSGPLSMCVSVSGLQQMEDDVIARLYGGMLCKQILVGNGLLAA